MMLSLNAVSLLLSVRCPPAAIPHQSFCLFLKLQFLDVFYPFDFRILCSLHPPDPISSLWLISLVRSPNVSELVLRTAWLPYWAAPPFQPILY